MIKKLNRKIGILGGSFDPPTISHLQLCSEALNVLKFDEIWMIPCGIREDKQLRTSGEMRLQMVERAIEDYFPRGYPVRAHDIEVKNGKSIPTYFLMKKLEELYAGQNMDFYFMMGSDLVPTLSSWDNGDDMIKEVKFIVYERKGYENILDENVPHDFDMPKCMEVIKAN